MWVVAVLVGVAAAAYSGPLFFGKTFCGRDHVAYAIPSREVLAAALRAGRLPLWWDGVDLGVPFAANPMHGVFYPPVWLVALLPTGWAIDFVLILHALVGACGSAALARRFGADLGGAALAGAAFECSGYVASMMSMHMPLLGLAWTPWIAWASHGIAAGEGGPRGRRHEALVLGALVGAQLLAGDAAAVITAALVASGIVLLYSCSRVAAMATLGMGYLPALRAKPVTDPLSRAETQPRLLGQVVTANPRSGPFALQPVRHRDDHRIGHHRPACDRPHPASPRLGRRT